jgi:subtilisin family serine protease
MQMLSAAGTGASTEQFASQHGIPIRNGQVEVVVRLSTPGLSAIVAQAIRQSGLGLVRAYSDHFISLQIPLNFGFLLKLVNLSGVGFIRAPLSPQALTVSEGVALTGAANLQNAGIRGQCVKIAVIDLGFAGLSAAQGAGQLPGNIVAQDFSGSGLETGTSHGTGVAEIVYNMAPAAQLYLFKISDEVDLENAVNQAINQGVRIINHSVGWLNTNFYDGTGIIDDTANKARAAGILWVSSVGNYAQRHWQGPGSDNGSGWVNFSPGNPSLTLNANAGDVIQLYLTWNDWPATAQDYDLFLFDDQGVQVASSEGLQTGTEPPTENIFYAAGHSGTYSVRVKLSHVTSPKQLAIFSLNHDLNPSIAQSSVVAPADAQTVVAVGAIDRLNWSSGPQESFSSQGPTTDGRVKPDLMGPDDVSTFTLGSFLGTSAASPHVAGAAALLLSQNPNQTADQLISQLRSQAINMGSPFVFGSGRLNLTSQTPPPTGLPDLVIRNATFSPSAPCVGNLITISAQVVNQGSAAAGPFAVQVNDGFGTATQNLPRLAAGASSPVAFQRQLQASTETVTITADPFNQVTESNKSNNTVQLQIMASCAPPPPTLSIHIQTDRTNYQIGDPISVQFSLSAQAFVYIYDVDPTGAVSLLFPSSESMGQSLAAGSYDLGNLLGGMGLRVNGPAGLESVHALATSSAINLQLNGLQNTSFTNTNVFHSQISSRIQAFNPSLVWAWHVASFQVGSTQPLPNQPPIASFNFSPSNPQVNQVVTFDGSGSSDPNGFITNWHWIFQGASRTELDGVRVTVQFSAARTYQVTLIVTDNQGATGSATQFVQVTAPTPSDQPPIASFAFSPNNPQVNQIVTFDGSGSSDPDGFIVSWHWIFQGDSRVETDGVRVSVRFTNARTYQVTLIVTDNAGLSSSTTQTVNVSSGTPPPTPGPTPSQAGFFLYSQDANSFHIIVRGDPSWTTDHAFQANFTLTGLLSGNISFKVTGNATPQTTHYAVPATLTGTVRDGMIDYTVPLFNARERFDFDLQMDVNGDGKLDSGTTVPIFFIFGNQNFRVPSNPFFIVSRSGRSLLPFGSLELCTYISPTVTDCNPFPGGGSE